MCPDDEELSVLTDWLASLGRNGKPPNNETLTHTLRCMRCLLLIERVLVQVIERKTKRHEDN